MKSLYEALFTAIGPRMLVLVSEDSSIIDMFGQSEVLRVWCDVLSFGRWLQTEDSAPHFGRRLVAKIVSANHPLMASSVIDPQSEKLCSRTLAILLDEFHQCPESSRLSHLDVVVATYLSFCRIIEPSGKSSGLITL
jgi:hypothetical protein